MFVKCHDTQFAYNGRHNNVNTSSAMPIKESPKQETNGTFHKSQLNNSGPN